MTFYPDDGRTRTVVEYLRKCDDGGAYQREIHTALGMNKNSVWKVIQALVEDGIAERIQTDDGPAGHKRLIIRLEEWELLTDEQKERLITALERIADMQERMMVQGCGIVFNIGTATINNRPIECPCRHKEVKIPPRPETKSVEGTE